MVKAILVVLSAKGGLLLQVMERALGVCAEEVYSRVDLVKYTSMTIVAVVVVVTMVVAPPPARQHAILSRFKCWRLFVYQQHHY